MRVENMKFFLDLIADAALVIEIIFILLFILYKIL